MVCKVNSSDGVSPKIVPQANMHAYVMCCAGPVMARTGGRDITSTLIPGSSPLPPAAATSGRKLLEA